MSRLPLLAALLLAPTAAAEPLVSGFATDLPAREGDDAFELWNPDPGVLDLGRLLLRDGEGQLTFPVGATLEPGARARIALGYEDYERAARSPPDYAPDHPDPARQVVATQRFLLAQSRDELWIERDGVVLDLVAWGDGAYEGPGWSGPRASADGNTSLRWWSRADEDDRDRDVDWVRPQRERLGWRVAAAAPAARGDAVAYAAPDHSREQVTAFLRSAQRSLRVNIYELRDPGIARDLLAALAGHPGLRVDLLTDAQPVGLDAEERLVRDRILRELEAAGARVRLLEHERYGFDHAKYLVADDVRVLVQSENLVASGVPLDATSGNRGWGVVVASPDLATSLAAAFDHDFTLDPYGARLLGDRESGDVPLPIPVTRAPAPARRAPASAPADVALLVGPEANLGRHDLVLATLRAARDEVLVQQLRVPPTWRDSTGREWPNAYLEAVLDAARRGVRVRVLLDGSFLDGTDDDNAATLGRLAERAGGADLEARLWTPPGGVLHNKGLIVDGRYAFVGSLNWNLQSVAQNREVLLRLDSPVLAGFYRDTLLGDWDAAATTGVPAPSATLMALVLLALAATTRRRNPE